jgi:DNA-binding GntR family transcriptional regulator
MSRASDHAYAAIRGLILSGELAPGSQLSEEALAERCGVSRTPVRDALRRLESELFIRRSESQRSFVAEWSPGDLEDAFELRAMLEGLAARRAAQWISPLQLEQLRSHNRRILEAISANEPDVLRFLEHNREFHAIVLEAANSSRLAAALALLIEQPVVWRTAQSYGRDNLQRSHHEHEELLAAFTRGDGEWAAAIMTGHIRRAFHAYADAYAAQHSEPQRSVA